MFGFSLLITSLSGAEVYKWVDDKGKVHYGDCPPPDCASKEVPVVPAPTAEAVEAAKERLRRLQESEKRSRKIPEEAAPSTETTRATTPAGKGLREIECFTPLAKAWGGGIADSREGPTRKPLTDAALHQTRALFGALQGSWTGTIVETNCIAADATPATETNNFDVRLEGRWEHEPIFRLEAKLHGRETRDVMRQFYWFAPGRDGLRAYAAPTDLSVEIDIPGNDVEIIEVRGGELAFFWRHGRGGVREASVFSLRRAGQGFKISEFFFLQGTCSGKRIWTIRR